MNVHIDGKEKRGDIYLYKDNTCWHLKLKEVLQDFLATLKQGTMKAI